MMHSFQDIDTFVLDIDGVLTDGSLIVHPDGFLRTMNVKDGYAIQLAIKKGYKIIIISGAANELSKDRLTKLGITELHLAVTDKALIMKQIMGVTLYMGDDMPDLAAMKMATIAACPNDACIDIQKAADYISPFGGGKGAVRDVIEKVLKLRGDWE